MILYTLCLSVINQLSGDEGREHERAPSVVGAVAGAGRDLRPAAGGGREGLAPRPHLPRRLPGPLRRRHGRARREGDRRPQ